ncbi:MAG: ABC transporter ATP-binding protein [Bacteroidetes bacterium]|nr:ABC transporter ATP-binding protein [Bacteroidota bacterium]
MSQVEKIIEVKNLVKDYGKFRAVDDVSFDVFQGDVFGFLGPNGAGKSTTIRTMLTLISATSGEIKIFGKELNANRKEILAEIGCIVEKPDFYKYLSAQKNLEIFARVSGKNVSKSKIAEVIEFVGLKGRENDKVNGFSHGMRQRLGIAQTLIHDPKLIILDEPTTGLDPQGILDIRNLILQLKNERNKTVLLSSHILSEIELIANRMVIISKGKTLVQGNVRELLDEKVLLVSFAVNDQNKAIVILQKEFPNAIQSTSNDQILLHLSKDEIPVCNKLLTDSGISVYSIESKRKLEDYFLKLINS